ncbi:hypothetical protein Vadar_003134 [Vaccinium darrowii]|uniref:Uncharacterized protein n=1 Tax=Vaccinium darrowii TaxID=229202 RepID=A0ACB7XFJ3_9ERIC|nr:hypothetical protein Vadar_003134 [Vaccinium darrowii]
MDGQDEAEETLSFSDLPIYSSEAADWENLSKEHRSLLSSSSISSSDQVFFEFFCEDCSNSNADQNILFCGKVFPSKHPIHIETTDNLEKDNPEKPKTRFLLRWKSNLFGKQTNARIPKLRFWKLKGGEKYGFSFRGLSSLVLPGKKLVLGFQVPAEMELKDIKSRQNRRDPPAALFSGGCCGGGDKKVGGGKGLWTVIGALSCGGGHRGEAQFEEILFERSRSCGF